MNANEYRRMRSFYSTCSVGMFGAHIYAFEQLTGACDTPEYRSSVTATRAAAGTLMRRRRKTPLGEDRTTRGAQAESPCMKREGTLCRSIPSLFVKI